MQLSGVDAKNAISQFAHEQAHEVADLRAQVLALPALQPVAELDAGTRVAGQREPLCPRRAAR